MSGVSGPFVAIVTPFDADEAVNPAALRRQVARQRAVGNGIFCAGTNGEFYALSFEEKILVAETCVAAAEGKVPVLAHIGETSTGQTIRLGKVIETLGVAAVSVITPSFLPCSQDELIAHYRAIADALAVPVFLYNIPSRTGNTVLPQTARRLADHPNIAGIKDSAGSQESLDGFLALAREIPGFDVLVGPDSLIQYGLANGAAGCISGLANVCPETVHGIYAAMTRGDVAEAVRLQNRCSELRKSLYALGFPPAAVKRALRHVMPEVGLSRGPVIVPRDIDEKIEEVSRAYAEAIA